MNELPGVLVVEFIADEIIVLEGWRQELMEGDRN